MELDMAINSNQGRRKEDRKEESALGGLSIMGVRMQYG